MLRSSTRTVLRRHRRHYSSCTEDWDVVIVGGGPAGLAFASALTCPPSTPLKVALIEAGDLDKVRLWNPPPTEFSNRVSSITNASRDFLSEVGAWEHVEHSRTTPIEAMEVSDGVSDARISFNANDLGTPQMSQMTENLNLQRALLRQLDRHRYETENGQGASVLDKTKVVDISKDGEEGRGGFPLVRTSDGRTLRARLLVGADGINSPVRSFAGIGSFGWSYDTHAVVATLHHPPRLSLHNSNVQNPNTTLSNQQANTNTTAYQRFLPTGPIAFLPLSPTTSSLVWSTTPSLASILTKKCDPNALALMINAAFRLPWVSMKYLHDYLSRSVSQGEGGVKYEELVEEVRWREMSHGIDAHSSLSSLQLSTLDQGIPPEGAYTLPPLLPISSTTSLGTSTPNSSIQPSSVASFPLRMIHADTYIGLTSQGQEGRTALIGDAAHIIHPLAGQGLNMGLADARSLANTVKEAMEVGGDIGSYTSLSPYPPARYVENHALLSTTDKLHKLYGTEREPVVWARSVGLEVVNELDGLKGAIMLSAGAGTSFGVGARGMGWTDVAASAVEFVTGSIRAAQMVGKSVGGQGGAVEGLGRGCKWVGGKR